MNTGKIDPNLKEHPYIRFFKRIGGNLHRKLVGLHLLLKLKRVNLFHFSGAMEGDISLTPLECVH